jgi:hypothetical protein
VLINLWNNDFYNTLQNLDEHDFYRQLRFALLAGEPYRRSGLSIVSQSNAADSVAALAHQQLS